MQFQYSSSVCLNIDTVDAETTVSGKEFHMLITLRVKRFSLNWSLECFLYTIVWKLTGIFLLIFIPHTDHLHTNMLRLNTDVRIKYIITVDKYINYVSAWDVFIKLSKASGLGNVNIWHRVPGDSIW